MTLEQVESIRVEEVMAETIETASEDDDLSHVLAVMRDRELNEIPVVSGKKLVGVVSQEALFRRRTVPMGSKVGHVMVPSPGLRPGDSFMRAAEMFITSGMRTIPVTHNGNLMGVIDLREFVLKVYGREEMAHRKVSDLMSKEPHVIEEGASVMAARSAMKGLDERTLPVVDSSGRLTGVIAVKDLLGIFSQMTGRKRDQRAEDKSRPSITVSSVMRTPPITLGQDSSIGDALDIFGRYSISSIIIVEKEGIPSGVLTLSDMVEAVAAQRDKEQVLVQVTGLEREVDEYDTIYDIIQKSLKKLARYCTPTVLAVHGMKHGLEDATYTMRLRLSTDHGMQYAAVSDWSLYGALGEALDQLETRLQKERERERDIRKRSDQIRKEIDMEAPRSGPDDLPGPGS